MDGVELIAGVVPESTGEQLNNIFHRAVVGFRTTPAVVGQRGPIDPAPSSSRFDAAWCLHQADGQEAPSGKLYRVEPPRPILLRSQSMPTGRLGSRQSLATRSMTCRRGSIPHKSVGSQDDFIFGDGGVVVGGEFHQHLGVGPIDDVVEASAKLEFGEVFG